MKKKHLIITAGPTYEPIDPVRGITNRSTGLLGYEIAKQALERHYKVTLITGPVQIAPPQGVKLIRVLEAREMKMAVMNHVRGADAIIMSAAVSDFRVLSSSKHKIKKQKKLVLKLVENPDILKAIKKAKLRKIGFALESKNLISNARKKLNEKKLDVIVANKIDRKNMPFGFGRKNYCFITKTNSVQKFYKKTKKEIAGAILDTLKNIVL